MITPSDVAISQVGVTEATGRNDGVPSERYQRNPYWTPGRPEAERVRAVEWCSLFGDWCYRASDWRPLLITEREWWEGASSTNVARILRARGWEIDPALAAVGDVVVYKRRSGSDRGGGPTAGHLGIVVQRTRVPGYLLSVEGNMSNGVLPILRNLKRERVNGVFRAPPEWRHT